MKPPLFLWYALGIVLLSMGSFFGYAGVKLILANIHLQLASSLTIFGTALAIWGVVVLYRCVRRG